MLRLDPKRKTYSAEIKHRTFGRRHLALKTKVHAVAMRRHAALEQLLDAGEPVRDLVEALRARKLTVQAVEECVRSKLPFETLRPSTWPTLGDGLDAYLAHLAAGEGSEKTTLSVVHAMTHARAHFGDDQRLESITHEDVDAFKVYLAGLGLHSNTVRLYLTKFGALYTFLQARETRRALQAKRQPATLFSPLDRDVHLPDHRTTRVRFLAEAEAERVLAATPARMTLAVALGLFAGLRMGEILMLRPGVDVDLEHGLLFIQGRGGERPHAWTPKYKKNREVPISSALWPYVEQHLARFAGPAYCFPGQRPGLPRSERNFQYLFTRVVSDAGLETGREHPAGVTIHTLRHTFASWLVMAGADLLTVSRLMGHSSIKQVQDTYAHLSPQHRLATVELLSTRWASRDVSDAGRAPQETPSDVQ